MNGGVDVTHGLRRQSPVLRRFQGLLYVRRPQVRLRAVTQPRLAETAEGRFRRLDGGAPLLPALARDRIASEVDDEQPGFGIGAALAKAAFHVLPPLERVFL